RVDNTLLTLQLLARYHRRAMNIPVVAITGTNGKTTTKELTAAALARKYRVLATEGNLNNHIGVPLTLLKLRDTHQIAIIEMGASHPGDIRELVEIAEPDFGLITNVGKAHLQGFGSFAGVIKTKCELYDYIREHSGKIFIRHDDEWLQPASDGVERIEYGEMSGVYVNGRVKDCSPFLSVTVSKENEEPVDIVTRLIGGYNLYNVLAAVTIALYFDLHLTDIAGAISDYMPNNSRSQLIKSNGNDIILDAYNANPSSMKAAIENFAVMNVTAKMLILGDMLELGDDSRKEHERVIEMLHSLAFDDVLLVGEEFSECKDNVFCKFVNIEGLMAYLSKVKPVGKTVLIKGSRGMKLERCLPLL
ncbi:MAG: UDP-N-acetylmuramoyl-tripeptide--D-alanyl-D-alanine ligase, partial [Bacteroidales bacterium]